MKYLMAVLIFAAMFAMAPPEAEGQFCNPCVVRDNNGTVEHRFITGSVFWAYTGEHSNWESGLCSSVHRPYSCWDEDLLAAMNNLDRAMFDRMAEDPENITPENMIYLVTKYPEYLRPQGTDLYVSACDGETEIRLGDEPAELWLPPVGPG